MGQDFLDIQYFFMVTFDMLPVGGLPGGFWQDRPASQRIHQLHQLGTSDLAKQFPPQQSVCLSYD